MPAKPNNRNWNDVQTAIATVSIVTTLGLWNLFATPSKPAVVEQTSEPTPVIPPMAPATMPVPTVMPQVKIMFTQVAPQNTVVIQQPQQKKKKNNNNDDGGGGGGGGGGTTVTQTTTS
jgi:hypothetical protein